MLVHNNRNFNSLSYTFSNKEFLYCCRMSTKWVIFITLLHIIFLDGVISFGNCPVDCSCGLDDRGRLQTICNKGNVGNLFYLIEHFMDDIMNREYAEISGATN